MDQDHLTRRSRPTIITDAPEHRSIPLDRVELRDASEGENSNEIVLEGYASTFEEYEMYGGPANFGWIERIDPEAFAKTLREKPDLHLLINHAGMPLARTKSGTLDLSVDNHGLKVVARLDKRDPEVQALAVKMERGDMDEMSFAFRVKGQEWRAAPGFEDIDDQSYRTITEVSLHKGDVSVVNWGANPTTSAGIKSSLRALAEADEAELAELREDDELMKVVRKLTAVEAPTGTFVDGILSVNDIRRLEGLEPVEERDADDDPSSLIAGIDAAVDQALELIMGVDRESLAPEVTQALDLMVAVDTLVDKLMEITGVYDPLGDDEEGERSAEADVETRDEEEGTVAQEAVDEVERAEIVDGDEALPPRDNEDAEAELSEPATEPTARGMNLRDALALRGIVPDGPLSLAAALALAE